MKQKLYLFLAFSLLLFFAQLSGKILETYHFKEITKHLTPNCLVILDIDDTLLIPAQTLGTDVWYQHRLKHYNSIEKDPAVALDKALSEWQAIRFLTKVKIVEEDTDKIIEQMQKKNIPIMGLSTQELVLTTCTANQLKSLNIDLSKTPPTQEDQYFISQRGVLFRHGILFTSGTPKGVALFKLLDILNYRPEHIIFINDKLTHLKDVEDSVEKRGITFTGLRYSHGDARVASFRPELTEIQLKHSTFRGLISDEEAEKILKQQNSEA